MVHLGAVLCLSFAGQAVAGTFGQFSAGARDSALPVGEIEGHAVGAQPASHPADGGRLAVVPSDVTMPRVGDRGSNIIYYVFLESARRRYGREGVVGIVSAGNEFLKRLEVPTRIVGLFFDEGFSTENLGPHDKLAILGGKDEVLDFALRAKIVSGYLDRDVRAWRPSAMNPERSHYSGGGAGRWTVVSLEASAQFAAKVGENLSETQAAAFLAVHGVGHQAGIGSLGHPDANTFMAEGAHLVANISGQGGFLDSDFALVVPVPTPVIDLFDPGVFRSAKAAGRHSGNTETQYEEWRHAFGKLPAVMGYFQNANNAALSDESLECEEVCN